VTAAAASQPITPIAKTHGVDPNTMMPAIATASARNPARRAASSRFRPMHLYVLAAVLYFIMSYPLAVMAGRLEARLARGR